MAPITPPANWAASDPMAELALTLGTLLKWAGWLAAPAFLLPFLVLLRPGLAAPIGAGLVRALDQVSGAALRVAAACAVLILVSQMAVVIARYVFGLSFSWLDETVVYAYAALFLLAAAPTLRDDEHVRVDILRPRFGPRLRAAIELAGVYLFIVPIAVLVFWSAISPSFVQSWARFEGSRESDGLPILFLFRTLIPVFATLLMAQGLSQAIKAALILTGRRAPEALHAQGGGA